MENFDCNEKENCKASEFNCSFLESLPKSIKSVISWKCPVVTGSILVTWVIFAVMVKTMSFISVIAYIGLILIMSSMLFRFYSNFINNEASNPFQECLDKDVNLYLSKISDFVHFQTSEESSQFKSIIKYLNSIFLLESYADVGKFLVGNVAMVYVGMYFNLIDLVTLAVLSLLTGPKVYNLYRRQIDDAVMKAREHVGKAVAIAKEKLATLPVVGTKMKQI